MLGRLLLTIEAAKQQAIEASGNNGLLIEAVINEWDSISSAHAKNMFELEKTIELLRNNGAPWRAPKWWSSFAQEGTKLWDLFDGAVQRGDPREIKKFIAFVSNFIRQYNNAISQMIAY